MNTVQYGGQSVKCVVNRFSYEPTGRGDSKCDRELESARPYLLSKVKYEDEVEDEEGEDDEDSSCELLLVAAHMGPKAKAVPLRFSAFSCFTASLLPHAFSVSTALKWAGVGVILVSPSVQTVLLKASNALTAEAGAGAGALSAIRVTALTLLPLVLHLAVSTCSADDERLQEGTGGKETERVRRCCD